jgi:tRNA 2-thiouridine synthesizing protein A
MDSQAPTLEVDCRGMACPRPIVELAKLRRRELGPVVLVVTADDLAFESDVRAWCEVTGSALLTLVRGAGAVVATIRFAQRT